MLLLRLCPLIPFHALNYIGGIAGVSCASFALSLIGILPSTILTVSIGATAKEFVASRGSEEQQLLKIVLMTSGLAFVVIAMVITYYFAKKELGRELEAAAALESTQNLEEANSEEIEVVPGVNDEEWFWMFT